MQPKALEELLENFWNILNKILIFFLQILKLEMKFDQNCFFKVQKFSCKSMPKFLNNLSLDGHLLAQISSTGRPHFDSTSDTLYSGHSHNR